jgi:hypothetical protein
MCYTLTNDINNETRINKDNDEFCDILDTDTNNDDSGLMYSLVG